MKLFLIMKIIITKIWKWKRQNKLELMTKKRGKSNLCHTIIIHIYYKNKNLLVIINTKWKFGVEIIEISFYLSFIVYIHNIYKFTHID